MLYKSVIKLGSLGFLLLIVIFSWSRYSSGSLQASELANHRAPRVHVPYMPPGGPYPSHSIFWYGAVGPSANYSDIRMLLHDDSLMITAHIVDRQLFHGPAEPGVDLTQWDALSIFINLDGNVGDALSANSYRFDVQLGFSGDPEYNQRTFKGSPGGWVETEIAFSSVATYRGDNGPNSGGDSKGWQADLTIPFESFGLSGRPADGTRWGLAVATHDRDSFAGVPVTTKWSPAMDLSDPSTWGELSFGALVQKKPLIAGSNETIVRQGLNGAVVPDAHVGGHATCGDGVDHWSEWGEANYAGYSQINIQNQWDISDYPCFSKFYITFPLDAIPAGQEIVDASVTLYLFGNAGYEAGQAPDSAIQALWVSEGWDEQTITWNNAPLALENLDTVWVKPVDFFDPGVPYTWDVTQAVAEALRDGEPLRLAFYSADGDYHTGKYFWSSNSADEVYPTLKVRWGDQPLNERLYLSLISGDN